MLEEKSISWIKSILSGLNLIDGDNGKKILEYCGRECAKSDNLGDEARKIRLEVNDPSNYDLLFDTYKERYYNTPRLYKKDDIIYLEYHFCGCPLVESGQIDDPNFCNCTVGYTKERYENLFNRPVIVELQKSILKGDKICKQAIKIM